MPRVLALGLLFCAAAQARIVRFTACGTVACSPQDLFDVVADNTTQAGRELIRLGEETLRARVLYDWVPPTPIICSGPQKGEGPYANLSLPSSTEHDWHCVLDEWQFFRNGHIKCGGTPSLFDADPSRYIGPGRNFCPWSSSLLNCSGCPNGDRPTNGSYILQFFANATKADLELARLAVQREFDGAVTRELPGYGPFGTYIQATFGDRHQPAALKLPGVHRVEYDLPA
jgi:hypothetical protein